MKKKLLAFSLSLIVSLALVVFTRRALSPHLPRALEAAIWQRANVRARLILAAGADPNGIIEDKFICVNDTSGIVHFSRPIHEAAWAGNDEALLLLLNRGANIDATTSGGATALWYAALGGHANTTRLLIEHGANPNLPRGDHPAVTLNPLEQAAEEGEPEVVRVLLDHGARENGYLNSSLFKATSYGKVEAVKFLLSRGADPNYFEDGYSVLDKAMRDGTPGLVEILKEAGARKVIFYVQQ